MEMKEMVYTEHNIGSEILYHEDFGDGTALEDEDNICPCCGAPVREDWNFCNKCGTKLS